MTTSKRPPRLFATVEPLIIPALIVGVLCSLLLLAISEAAKALQKVWWDIIPGAFGVSGSSWQWIVVVLLGTGVLVALVVRFVPGNAGPDPATVSLVDKPLPGKVVPGLIIAVILMLAGGVSLGPENPIMAVNSAIILLLGAWLHPKVKGRTWVNLAVAGTIGALFGTPVAAALLLSEELGSDERPLWDKLIAPLLAAAAGSITTNLIVGLDLSLTLPAYRGFELIDILSGAVIVVVAALAGMVAVYFFPLAHRAFARIGHQSVTILVGALGLAVLGVLASVFLAAVPNTLPDGETPLDGTVTLFKGLDQMNDLSKAAAGYAGWVFLVLAVIKLVAIVIAGTSGFRGGRIFPALFAGVALGLAAHAFVPAIPISLAVAAAALGMLLAITRLGWLSLFMALVTVPDIALLPLLCVLVIPGWLIVSGRPQMLIPKERAIPV